MRYTRGSKRLATLMLLTIASAACGRDAPVTPGNPAADSYVPTPAAPVFPLRASANGRFLEDQNGGPVPILGRTAWFVISLSETDYTTFLNDTVSRGYNAIELHVIDHDPRGNDVPRNGNGDLPFRDRLDGAAWTGALTYADIGREAPDFTTPNEAYWKFVDRLPRRV